MISFPFDVNLTFNYNSRSDFKLKIIALREMATTEVTIQVYHLTPHVKDIIEWKVIVELISSCFE